MNLVLQERLFRSYPVFYRKSGDEFDRRPIDQWGIEVGDGWSALLDHLSAKIEQAITDQVALGLPLIECPRAAQIKQKFGGLRVHIDGRGKLPTSIETVIADAERMANEICETCGSQGYLRKIAWIHVACDRCEQIDLDVSSNGGISNADLELHFSALELLLENRSKGWP